MNAPLVHAAYGYGLGIEAPGLTLLAGALFAGRNQLLGHGAAVAGAARRRRPESVSPMCTRPVRPASAGPATTGAAQLLDALINRAFTDPAGRPTVARRADHLPRRPADEWDAADAPDGSPHHWTSTG